MSEVKRKIKNIIRNFIFFTKLNEVKLIKKIIENRRKKIEENRGRLFKLYAEETLNLVKKILDDENIIFWLDFGTLLGAVREKDFIAHDIDIDFGIKYDALKIQRLEEVFKENNIVKCREFLLEEKIVEQTYRYKGLDFDIFYYFEDKKEMWCYGFTFENSKLKKIFEDGKDISTGIQGMRYITPIRGLEKIKFKEKMYFVPENPHEYLMLNYGKNYMIPRKEWDYVEEAKNQEKIDESLNIKMIEYFN